MRQGIPWSSVQEQAAPSRAGRLKRCSGLGRMIAVVQGKGQRGTPAIEILSGFSEEERTAFRSNPHAASHVGGSQHPKRNGHPGSGS